jgi:hypothetical protein
MRVRLSGGRRRLLNDGNGSGTIPEKQHPLIEGHHIGAEHG